MSTTTLPLLENGDRLTRTEFERRYEAMLGNRKAELIDGVVYLASPTKIPHARFHGLLTAWLCGYEQATPGVVTLSDGSLRLDEDNEPKPDLMLRRVGGTSRADEDDYVRGGVELVVEVAASSASYDLHQKKDVYRRLGCREYVVVVLRDQAVRWFVLEDGQYVEVEAESDGVLRSRAFAGLWLDPKPLFDEDAGGLLAALRRGVAARDGRDG